MKGDNLLRIPAMAERYDVSEYTIRRYIKRRDGSIPSPAFAHPWRWRVSDVDAHISSHTVTEQRKRQRERLRLAARDQQPTT